MLSIVSKTRFALRDDENFITDYEWDDAQEKNGYIILYNDERLEVYNKDTGVRKLYVYKIEDFKSTENHLLIKQAGNWGMYEFSGECIIPCEYECIGKEIYSIVTKELIAVEVDTEYETGGYYILSKKKYYPADDINITKTNRIELLVNGNWEILD